MKRIALIFVLFLAFAPVRAQEVSPSPSPLSDRDLKKEIFPIRDALTTVSKLEGVTFRWRDEKLNAASGRVMGMIAQDVSKVIPGWVKEDPDVYMRLETTGIDALLIEAIKEQQRLIEEQRRQLLELRRMVELLVAKEDKAD